MSWTFRDVLTAMTCRHPRMPDEGYWLTESVWVQDYDCPDCGLFGDSTCGGSVCGPDNLWAEYVFDSWLREAVKEIACR